MPLVIDASVTMAWCFEDETTPVTEAALDRVSGGGVVVPQLWRLEVTNVLLVAERRMRITEAQSARFVELLRQLPIRVDASVCDVATLLSTARRHDLSAYDAGYLALAERLGASLATLDDRLAAACRTAGVPLLLDG